MVPSPRTGAAAATAIPQAVQGSSLLRAARGEPTSTTPVWFMRQAGRSLPEYHAVRDGMPMLEACRRPDLVATFTLQPVHRHRVDAAVLFSDIVVPLVASGLDIEIVPGVGPVLADPIRTRADLARVRPPDPEEIGFVADAVRLVVRDLGDIPLVGFAGAPFTLASYLIEGGPSRTHARTKALMHGEPELWSTLLDRLADTALVSLRAQVEAGAAVVQLFDSWAGALSDADYRRFVLPHSRKVLDGLADLPVPRIHFGVGAGELLPAMAEAGADVVGVDWRIPLDEAARRVPGHALQGNLDPALLLADWDVVEREVRRILDEGRAAPGHIFNLGHGVLPETDPQVLTRVVELVHEVTTR
jgi:uroporphyrinogen decarboxylase